MENVKNCAEAPRPLEKSFSNKNSLQEHIPNTTILHGVLLRRKVHSRRLETFTAKIVKRDFWLESFCISQRAELNFEKHLVIASNNITI